MRETGPLRLRHNLSSIDHFDFILFHLNVLCFSSVSLFTFPAQNLPEYYGTPILNAAEKNSHITGLFIVQIGRMHFESNVKPFVDLFTPKVKEAPRPPTGTTPICIHGAADSYATHTGKLRSCNGCGCG